MNLKPIYFDYQLLHYKSSKFTGVKTTTLFLIQWIYWEVTLVSPGSTGVAADKGGQLWLEYPKGSYSIARLAGCGLETTSSLHVTSHPPGRSAWTSPNVEQLKIPKVSGKLHSLLSSWLWNSHSVISCNCR